MRRTLLLVAVVTAVAEAQAQEPTFRASVDLVALNVVVTDGQQKFIGGLEPQNFQVFEDGVPQDVSFFAETQLPLDMAILLDTSASMTDKIRTVQDAAAGFTRSLRPGDRAMVVDIKDALKILQPLSDDLDGARAAIQATTAKGGTALYNGLYLTLKEMVRERRATEDVRRQALVVLSDGDDTASLVAFDDVMTAAKESGIAIYTITLRSPYSTPFAASDSRRYYSQSEYSMKSIAQETGARAFFPLAIGELAGVYSLIAEELAAQYSLGYTPKNSKRDGAYRHVQVRILDHPGAIPRTRSGYTAAQPERRAGLR